MSETAQVRHIVLPYLKEYKAPTIIDVGCGGDKLVPSAIAVEKAYSHAGVGDDHIQILADIRSLPFKDNTIDVIYHSHVIEDFFYKEQLAIVLEHHRILKKGGALIIVAPDQRLYLEHCKQRGEQPNQAHKEPDMSFATFKSKVLFHTQSLLELKHKHNSPPYTWLVVLKKK